MKSPSGETFGSPLSPSSSSRSFNKFNVRARSVKKLDLHLPRRAKRSEGLESTEHLRHMPKPSNVHWLKRLVCGDGKEYFYEPSAFMVGYLNWTFTASFCSVFATFIVVYFILVFLFGLILSAAGSAQPACITISDGFGKSPRSPLHDGLSLSWTTFTAVGYGHIYPNGYVREEYSCQLINYLCVVEAFGGLLYAGMCAAILFSKIVRIQRHAQVVFSDWLCVEYGRKLKSAEIPLGDDSDVAEFTSCPELKFQLVNKLCNTSGGQIMNAALECLAREEVYDMANLDADDEDGVEEQQMITKQFAMSRFEEVALHSATHPYFKRVWIGRHKLNEDSPLLSEKAKQTIRSNGGHWPNEWNHVEAMNKHLRFSSLVVTMTGTSTISAEAVQIAKNFDRQDALCVGYQFADLMYFPKNKREDEDAKLVVDMSLLNVVHKQEV
jgi:hypothetical protein